MLTSADRLQEAARLVADIDTEYSSSVDTDIEIAKVHALIAIAIRLGTAPGEESEQ